MAMSDTIADMLTRVRNAAAARKTQVRIPNSKIAAGIARVLREEGYINDFDVIDDGRQGVLRIQMKYGPHGEQLIHTLRRESRPGCRVYSRVADLPRPLAGLGITIVSTSKGVLSDRQAREQNVGGELLCTVE
jgi:small subunit ribosomal protein S8